MAILSCPNIKKLTLFGVFKPFIQYSGGFSSKLFPTEVTSFFQKAYHLFPKSILPFGKEVSNCQFFHKESWVLCHEFWKFSGKDYGGNLAKPVNTVKTVLKHCLNTVLTALRLHGKQVGHIKIRIKCAGKTYRCFLKIHHEEFLKTSNVFSKTSNVFLKTSNVFFENNGYSKFPLRIFHIELLFTLLSGRFFYRFKAILYASQPFHQPSQFWVSIISATLQFLIHRPIGISYSSFKAAAITLKVAM